MEVADNAVLVSIPAWLLILAPRVPVRVRVPAGGTVLILKLVASARLVSSAADLASQALLETLPGPLPGKGGGGGEGAAASFPKSGP